MSPAYEFVYAIEEGLGLGLVSGLISSIPSGLLGIAAYVLASLAMYTVAKRRGINHPWLSWVPVLNCWIIGSLSDQYRYVVKGQNKSKRKSLLILNIIVMVLSVSILILAVGLIGEALNGAIYGMYEENLLEDIIGPALGLVGLALPLTGVSIAVAVIYYMALYDIYTSMDPSNNVLFLVLSILFGVTEPFFLFFNRNKDNGMPPRREQPVYEVPPQPQWQQPQWPPQQPAEETWEDKDYL